MRKHFQINVSGILASIVFASIPMLYNACQPGQGFETSTQASQCFTQKASAFNSTKQKTSIFANDKVLLGYKNSSTGLQKASSDQLIQPEDQLVAYIDTECAADSLNHEQNKFSSHSFLSDLIGSAVLNTEIPKQAFAYSLSQPTTIAELEQLSSSESCLISITPHREYKLLNSPNSYNDSDLSLQDHHTDLGFYSSLSSFLTTNNGMAELPIPFDPVVVAVIDAGVAYTHSDLSNKMWTSPQGFHGVNATTIGSSSVDNNPFDISPISHGTHISGLIAAEINNGKGGHGLAPFGVEIMAVRIFKSENNQITASVVDLVNGINWAVQNGADVLNLSLGIVLNSASEQIYYDPLLKEAIRSATQDYNRIVVTASGNGSSQYPSQELTTSGFTVLPGKYAAEYSGMINVGSYNLANGAFSAFAHWSNEYIQIAAPGSENGNFGLYSTATPTAQGVDQYSRLQGTSQAAPLVSAAAAITIASLRAKYGVSPSASEVERLIVESAEKSAQLAGSVKDGNRLNLANLAAQIQQDYDSSSSVVTQSCN